VAMGLFGMSEVLENLSKSIKKREVIFNVSDTKIRNLFPNRKDWIDSAKPIGRGSLIGFFFGILPGFGAAIPTFISYAVEKKFSKHPEKFGTGIIEGVAGPESANNAASQATFIPLLSLGIPANPSTAVILGALMILGLQPGPLFISSKPDLFWGLVASMYLGNVMLVVLNLPLIGIWIQMLKIPYSILSVLIILFCQIGAYSSENNAFHILIMNVFGVFGYLMRRYRYEGAPLILALVLGPMLERSLRRSLIFSDGNPAIFFSRPISAVFLSVAIVLLISTLLTGQKIGNKAIGMKED